VEGEIYVIKTKDVGATITPVTGDTFARMMLRQEYDAPRAVYVIDDNGRCSCLESRFRGKRLCKHQVMVSTIYGPPRLFSKDEARGIAAEVVSRLRAVEDLRHVGIVDPEIVGGQIASAGVEVVLAGYGYPIQFVTTHRGMRFRVEILFEEGSHVG